MAPEPRLTALTRVTTEQASLAAKALCGSSDDARNGPGGTGDDAATGYRGGHAGS